MDFSICRLTSLGALAPGTPMLFQGQEFGSTRPFVYFADHDAELARAVAKGRREFLAQFPSLADPEVQEVTAATYTFQGHITKAGGVKAANDNRVERTVSLPRGTLTATSTPSETRFVFRMPLALPA